jgi:hypothetical protein
MPGDRFKVHLHVVRSIRAMADELAGNAQFFGDLRLGNHGFGGHSRLLAERLQARRNTPCLSAILVFRDRYGVFMGYSGFLSVAYLHTLDGQFTRTPRAVSMRPAGFLGEIIRAFL